VGFEPTVRLESSASASTDWSANSEARHTQSTSADLTLQQPRLHLFILRTSASSSSRSSAPNQARMTTSDAADKRSPFCPSIILTKARGYFRKSTACTRVSRLQKLIGLDGQRRSRTQRLAWNPVSLQRLKWPGRGQASQSRTPRPVMRKRKLGPAPSFFCLGGAKGLRGCTDAEKTSTHKEDQVGACNAPATW